MGELTGGSESVLRRGAPSSVHWGERQTNGLEILFIHFGHLEEQNGSFLANPQGHFLESFLLLM